MKRKSIALIVFFLSAAGNLCADLTSDVEAYFNDFLGRLTAKHPALETLAMPEREVRGPPGGEDPMTAAIILTFASAEEREVFHAALRAEEVPLFTFPKDDHKIMLFGIDMMSFIMMDVIGL